MVRTLGMALALWAASVAAHAGERQAFADILSMAQTAEAPEVAKRPEGATALAAVTGEEGRLYAATPKGLLLTRDGGVSWGTIYRRERPVTAVGTAAGMVYVYAPGEGLLASAEPPTAFRSLGDPATGDDVVQIAVDPADRNRMAVVDAAGRSAVSADGGRTWTLF